MHVALSGFRAVQFEDEDARYYLGYTATRTAVWLEVHSTVDRVKVRLTPDVLKAFLPYLQAFAETGKIDPISPATDLTQDKEQVTHE